MSASPPPLATRTGLVSPGLRKSLSSSRTQLRYAGLLASWHLLSLDAPTVAALWVVFIARAARIALPWTEPAAMFVAVWILYAADRLLDARASHRPAGERSLRDLEARHVFHHEHRRGFYTALLLACPLLLLLVRDLSPPALRLDFTLGGLLFVWLLLVHIGPFSRGWRPRLSDVVTLNGSNIAILSRVKNLLVAHGGDSSSVKTAPRSAGPRPSRLPKELAVGLFFPAAVFIPTVARNSALRAALLPDAILFAAVCSLNCLYIFAWEHPYSYSSAHWSTRSAVQHLRPWTAATIASSCVVAALYLAATLPRQGNPALALPALACGLSALCLLHLDRRRQQLLPLTLRAAADLCLLTPLLLLAPHLLHG